MRNVKNRLHSFFGGGRIRDGSGIWGYGAFFFFEKGAGTSMGRGLRDFFPVNKSYRSLPETKRTNAPTPSPFPTQQFERSFCASC